MSIIFEIDNNLSNVPDLVQRYDGFLTDLNDDLVLEGKTLQEANSEQCMLYAKYASYCQEVKTLERWMDTNLSKVKGDIWAALKRNNHIDLSSTDLQQYVAADPKYVKQKNMLMIVQELVGQYEVVVKSFEQRGYQLRNLTEMHIHEVNKFQI